MVEVVGYKKEHMIELLREEQNKNLVGVITLAQMEMTEKTGYAFTVIRKSDKKVLVCGGVTEYWKGRGEIWAVFTKNCRREFMAIQRVALKVIDKYPGRRIEASVAINFKEGHRWIKTLGFTMDAPLLKGYLPDGGDVSLYSRVK